MANTVGADLNGELSLAILALNENVNGGNDNALYDASKSLAYELLDIIRATMTPAHAQR